MRSLILLSALAVTALGGSLTSQAISNSFAGSYSIRSLGPVPGVPTPYGGITFKYDDPDVLLIGGLANQPGAAIYEIRVLRDLVGNITGFQGTASVLASAPNIDGGLQYGPQNVLFFTRYSMNGIGQIKVGSAAPDKLIDLTAAGFSGSSVGALSFVPPGFPGAGLLKTAAFNNGGFNSCELVPDGNGTFDLVNPTSIGSITGGPEGLLYPPPGSPLLADYSKLFVSEYRGAGIAVYDIDSNGDPILTTRTQFATGLGGAEGATVDASRGAFLFSTFGAGSQVYVVDGFAVCGTFSNYGTGIPDNNGGTPIIRGIGCASRNQAIRFEVGNGPPSTPGVMHLGFTRLNLPLFGGFVLCTPDVLFPHLLDATGTWGTTIFTPNDPNLVGNNVYFQAGYPFANSPSGVIASDGLEVLIL